MVSPKRVFLNPQTCEELETQISKFSFRTKELRALKLNFCSFTLVHASCVYSEDAECGQSYDLDK